MADNLLVTPGTGKTILMDEVTDGTLGTGVAGFGKIMDGTLDSTNKLVVDSTGALSNNQTRIGSNTIATGNGVSSTGVQRVAIASDNTHFGTKVYDSTDVGITSIADGAGGVGLGMSMMATNFVLSSNNSSTAQLAASATFTGTIETIFNQQAISILITADQNCTLHLKQYIDLAGTRLISDWTFSIVAGTPYSRCFVGNGNYFNLTLQNNGGSATTTLNINTAYGTLPPATNLGNSPSSINEINGTAVDSNSGNKSAGTQRVVLATDQPTVPTNDIATATGGYTPAKLISAASTNATLVKASAGTLGYLTASNINASPRYLKIYNKTSAPTVGTDVPVHTFLIPGNTAGAGTNIPLPSEGCGLSTGIAFAITTGAPDTDTGAVAANEIIVNYGTI